MRPVARRRLPAAVACAPVAGPTRGSLVHGVCPGDRRRVVWFTVCAPLPLVALSSGIYSSCRRAHSRALVRFSTRDCSPATNLRASSLPGKCYTRPLTHPTSTAKPGGPGAGSHKFGHLPLSLLLATALPNWTTKQEFGNYIGQIKNTGTNLTA